MCIRDSPESEYNEWCSKMSSSPFEMYDSPLYFLSVFRLNKNKTGYYIKLHHIVADGWSVQLFTDKVASAYEKLINGAELKSEAFYKYTDFIYNEMNYTMNPSYIKAKNFWLSMYGNLPDVQSECARCV